MSATAIREGVSYGFLDPTDWRWGELDRYMESVAHDALDRRLVRVAAATDPSGATSFFWVGPVMHAALVLNPAHRSIPGVVPNLAAMVQALIERGVAIGQTVMIVADNSVTVKMCEAAGLERVQVPVYIKHIGKVEE